MICLLQLLDRFIVVVVVRPARRSLGQQPFEALFDHPRELRVDCFPPPHTADAKFPGAFRPSTPWACGQPDGGHARSGENGFAVPRSTDPRCDHDSQGAGTDVHTQHRADLGHHDLADLDRALA